ncbi:hypothetical protein CB0101_08865 [Synechococcus sp. CB0101]|nr:hypothetical protein CB0101_08865 [Synechococcus sp. CB0101]
MQSRNPSEELFGASAQSRITNQMMGIFELIVDFLDFIRVRKKYWLAPLILSLVAMGALLVFTKGSVVAPFIYSLF